jgi:uncharacterized membrane protein
MADILVYISISVIIILLFIGNLISFLKTRKLSNIIIQFEIDRMALIDQLTKLSEYSQSLEIQQTDGFLKFISESREWAFGYIEEVQEAIVELHGAMEGSDTGKIQEAYNRLIKFLPNTNPDMVN